MHAHLCSTSVTVNVEQCTLPHLDKLTKEGALGLLAVRSNTASGPAAPAVSELAQLFGVHDVSGEGSVRVTRLASTFACTCWPTAWTPLQCPCMAVPGHDAVLAQYMRDM